MRFHQIQWTVAVMAIMAVMPRAQAEWHRSLGRTLGVGWGDGYHSRTACPPRRSVGYAVPQPHAIPWWAIPASEGEPLPHPATPPTGGTAQSHIPPGQSLFRQPGEGSSIVVPNGTGTMR